MEIQAHLNVKLFALAVVWEDFSFKYINFSTNEYAILLYQ